MKAIKERFTHEQARWLAGVLRQPVAVEDGSVYNGALFWLPRIPRSAEVLAYGRALGLEPERYGIHEEAQEVTA